jgi:hypothetical protein
MAGTGVKGEYGWDGPVAILMPGDPDNPKWFQDCKVLAASIQDMAPIGQGADAGQLKTDLSLRRAKYKRLPKPAKGFMLEVRNVYALIQDIGGTIPARIAGQRKFPSGYQETQRMVQGKGGKYGPIASAKAMRFVGRGGLLYFRARVGESIIKGSDYIKRGFERWMVRRGHSNGMSQPVWVDRQYETGGHGG